MKLHYRTLSIVLLLLNAALLLLHSNPSPELIQSGEAIVSTHPEKRLPNRGNAPHQTHTLSQDTLEKIEIANVVSATSLRDSINLSLFPSNIREISPDFIEAFDLSEKQADLLKNVADNLTSDLVQLRIERAVCKRLPDGQLEVTVPPFPQEGTQAFEKFLDEAKKIIGVKKVNAWLSFGSKSIEKDFDSLGRKPTKIELKVLNHDRTSGKTTFALSEQIETGAFAYHATLEELDQQHPGLLTLFPPDQVADILSSYMDKMKNSPTPIP